MRIICASVVCLLAFVVAAALAAPYPCTYTSPNTNNKVHELSVPLLGLEYLRRIIDRINQYDLSNMWRDGSKGQKDYSAPWNVDSSIFYVYARRVLAANLRTASHRLTRFDTDARAGTSVARQSSPTATTQFQMVCAKSCQWLGMAMAMPPSSRSPITVRLSLVCVRATTFDK